MGALCHTYNLSMGEGAQTWSLSSQPVVQSERRSQNKKEKIKEEKEKKKRKQINKFI